MADPGNGSVNSFQVFVRVLLVVALRDGQLSEKEVDVIRNIHRDVLGSEISPESLVNETAWVKRQQLSGMLDMLGAVAPQMPVEQKEVLLKCALMMVVTGWKEGDRGITLLHLLFTRLGLSSDRVSDKINEILERPKTSSDRSSTPPAQPTRSDSGLAAPPGGQAKGTGRNTLLVCLMLTFLVAASCAGFWKYRDAQYEKYVRSRDNELAALQAEIEYKKDLVEAPHLRQLKDPKVLDGTVARKEHEEEWRKRLAHDRQYARSKAEMTLIKVAELGRNGQLGDDAALAAMARLVAPPESTVKVVPYRGGNRIDVRFDMSKMTSGEHGARTKHTSLDSLKREVEEIMSRVMKDLYQNCKGRSLRKITVFCEHGVRQMRKGISQGVTMQSLYGADMTAEQAGKIRDWTTATEQMVMHNWAVVTNEFPNLRITTHRAW